MLKALQILAALSQATVWGSIRAKVYALIAIIMAWGANDLARKAP